MKKDNDRKLSAVTEWLHCLLEGWWNIEDPGRWLSYVRRFTVVLGLIGAGISEVTGGHQHKPADIQVIVDWLFSGATAGFKLFIGTFIIFSFVYDWGKESKSALPWSEEHEQKSTLPSGELFGAGVVASALLFVLALLMEILATHL